MQRRLSGEFENVTVAALVVGSDGTVSSANPAAHRMLGYPAGALRGQRIDAILPEHWGQVFEVFEAGRGLRFEGRAVKADGRLLDIGLTVEPTTKEPGPIGHVALLCRPLPPWASSSKHPPENEPSS